MDSAQWTKFVPEEKSRTPTWSPETGGNPGSIVEDDGLKYYVGPILEGGLVRDEVVNVKGEDRRVIAIQTTSGEVAFWPNAMACRLLDEMRPGPGDLLRIVFVGWKKSANMGRKYKTYEFYRRNAKSEVTEPMDNGQPRLEQLRAGV